MATERSGAELVERALDRSVAAVTAADWGFTNRTELVTLAGDGRVVLQRYRRAADARYRLEVMEALWGPAAEAGIAIPRVLAADLADEPPWVIFDALPGVPVAALGLDDARFPRFARMMGEWLAAFRDLRPAGLAPADLWAEPKRLVARAATWASAIPDLAADRVAPVLETVPELFAGRPAVLAHGDFAPVNVLTDGAALTGLLDLESVRLADPLLDVAWWSWAVSFGPAGALAAGRGPFLAAAGIDSSDPQLAARVEALQVLRMLELLGGGAPLDPGVAQVVAGRLATMLSPGRPGSRGA